MTATTTSETPAAERADNPPPDDIAEAMTRMMNRTPDQVMADRERAYAASTPPRPLPPGTTLDDVVGGQWPGDETDEEIRDLLRKLS